MRKFLLFRQGMWAAFAVASAICLAGSAFAQDPLPSWNDGVSKQAIVAFVEKVTKEGSPDFIPEPERIAVFDNDGTLCCERPIYFQGFFVIDRIKALAPQHPDWNEKEPFASLLKGDFRAALGGTKALDQIIMVTHAGMTSDEFAQIVANWLATARHPRFNRPYTELVYQPMVELLAYLQSNGFKNFIVSAGGAEFMRVFAEKVYDVPPEQIVGSTIKENFEVRNGKPVIVRLPAIDFIDDGAGKPVGIAKFIGRRPIMAFGNSDGDLQMLEYTAGGDGARFELIVHHDDPEREYAYDRKSAIGRLDKALDEATKKGWVVVSMKDDWKTIFPPKTE